MVHQTLRKKQLTIGTRGSDLALAQAHQTKDLLIQHHGFEDKDIQIEVIKTSGDRIADRPLSEVGGKGLFSKEIEEALLEGNIDVAVHSAKDMATTLPEGLIMPYFLPREDPRDAFISLNAARLEDLPHGATVGSASLRRKALIGAIRPDLNVVLFRGNVPTRLQKLKDGLADATLLAAAGLNRLGLSEKATQILDPQEFLPAVAQGAIGLQLRVGDDATAKLLAPLHHEETGFAVVCERAFLAALDGSCKTPIAGHARIEGRQIMFRGKVLLPDGSRQHDISAQGTLDQAESIGKQAGEEILSRLDEEFLTVLGIGT